MFAPSFPSYKIPRPCWHKVDPLDLVHSVCNPSIVVRCAMVRDTVPDDEKYCRVCAKREQARLSRT